MRAMAAEADVNRSAQRDLGATTYVLCCKDREGSFLLALKWDLILNNSPRDNQWNNHIQCKVEVFTMVTMKNVVFWDIKTQFIPHTRHVLSPLQSPAS
jgi:hypothetical protein